jgi:hypothetical protein
VRAHKLQHRTSVYSDRHLHSTVGFEPATQGSSNLYAADLIDAPRGRELRSEVNIQKNRDSFFDNGEHIGVRRPCDGGTA